MALQATFTLKSTPFEIKYTPPPRPIVAELTPKEEQGEGGGTSITITGTNFTEVTAVKFGTQYAADFAVNSGDSITAISPSPYGEPAVTVDVTVTTTGGTSATSAADPFTYVPFPTVTGLSGDQGSEAGGTPVIIIGRHLLEATAVKFGTANAASYTIVNARQIDAVSPAGTVDVTVTTPQGTSRTSSHDLFFHH